STAWQACRRLIYVPRSAQKGFPVGFWPIPESFWPDIQALSLPPRSAHPNVKFTCTSQDPMVIENLPFDKYELEPSPLTQYVLARKQPTICWQVFVPNSYKNSDVGHPFGYLKASTNLTCVNLFVMPYNYPVLLPLLDELFKVHRQKPTNEWRTAFSNYLRTMPPYYAGPLRRALVRMGASGSIAQSLVPENLDNSLSFSVLNHLKKLKNQAKMEYERMCNEVSGKQMSKVNQTEGVRVTPRSPLKRDLLSHPMLQDKFNALKDQLNEFGGFIVGVAHRRYRTGQSYRNAFDIPRRNLLDQVVRMRANFLQVSTAHTKLVDDDLVHSMPISQMGNYQEYLKKTQPQLREVESAPVRQHMFGNPFKIDKRMMVDEADIDLVGGGSGSGSGGGGSGGPGGGRGVKRSHDGTAVTGAGGQRPPNKRKPGPIPRDLHVRRPSQSPSPSPPPSLPPPTPPASPAHLPMQNGDISKYCSDDELVSPRSPSPPPDYSPPPVLQPYDGVPNHVGCNDDNSKPPPCLMPSYSISLPSSAEEMAEIRRHNLNVRSLAYREVRRPGRNYEPLFDYLETMKGNVDTRISLIKEVINESLRFKRRTLASHLDKQLKELIKLSESCQGNNGAR
ncbi:hypothetical protein AAG570_002461, partial [Ranatra chinensis]